MSPLPDLKPLLPSDEERRASRDALVSELRSSSDPSQGHAPAARRTTRRRVMRAGLAIGATGVVAAIGVTGVSLLSGSSVDVIASARAAAAPQRGGVLHMLVRFGHNEGISMAQVGDGPNGPIRGRLTGDYERWSTDDPIASRDIQFLDKPGGGQATIDTAYSGGVLRTKQSWERKTTVFRPDAAGRRTYERQLAPKTTPDLRGIDFSGDPVGSLQALLTSGKVREDGRLTFRGRKVIRLDGTRPGYVDAGGTFSQPEQFEYLIDAETYAPVRIKSVQVLPARPKAMDPLARVERSNIMWWDFEVFERLPLSPTTERLLTIGGRGD